MGFNGADIQKMRPEMLNQVPEGPKLDAIAPPPEFRADDYHYHTLCENYPQLVNDLGIIANLGDLIRMGSMFDRIRERKKVDILALGGSITAGGYFEGFAKLLRDKEGIEVTVHNHGHGATEIVYTLFCIEISHYQPDLVLIDFSVNDYGHPKLMDALIRKTLSLGGSYKPVVALVNLWVQSSCPTTKYLTHAQYYQLPLLNICPAVDLCYGKGHLPKWRWEEYSKEDGVHPWGEKGVPFIGEVLYSWYVRSKALVFSQEAELSVAFPKSIEAPDGSTAATSGQNLPPPLYGDHIGQCTRCDALASDSTASLKPVGEVIGFEEKTRVKIGFGGFNPTDPTDTGSTATKSFKKSWQAEKAGDSISFKFFGSSVQVAMWQRRDGMGVLEAMIDSDREKTALASGFFKGFSWAMEKNNTGRSEVVPLFEGLEDKEHVITFRVTQTPANTWVPGHTCQIFALLSASDNPKCKVMVQV
eukprot:GSChrysophyteH1.ASY1.ANO1.776.1 assembled CDS